MNGAVVASQLAGKTGVWFLQPSSSGWLVLSMVIGDLSTEDLYIPVPPGKLPAAYAYDSSTDLKTKLLMEIGAEKLRYLTGIAIAVNHKGRAAVVSLDDVYRKAARTFRVQENKITRAAY